MNDVIDRYGQAMEAVNQAMGGTTLIPPLRLNLLPVTLNGPIEAGHAGVLDHLARFDGDGWLECVDAVRLRHGGGDWYAPVTGASGPLPKDVRILAGEVCGKLANDPASLRIRHYHGNRWHIATIAEAGGAPCPSFDETLRGVLRIRDAGTGTDLGYRTYWDTDLGCAQAVRFTGFIKSGDSP